MKWSEQRNELAAALAKAQAAYTKAARDSSNPFFKSRYADLESVADACMGQLTANGICVSQDVTTADAVVSVTTTLVHASGQWCESSPTSAVAKDAGAQAIGSVITYLRRYQLAAVAGVVPAGEDDDGEAAQGRPREPQRPSPQQPRREPPPPQAAASSDDPDWLDGKQPKKLLDSTKASAIRSLCISMDKLGLTERDEVLAWCNERLTTMNPKRAPIASRNELTVSEARQLIDLANDAGPGREPGADDVDDAHRDGAL